MNGKYFTKTKLSNFCSMIPASKSFAHVVTYSESPIKIWDDLNNKRINAFGKATPAGIVAGEVFEVLGIKANLVYSTASEATDMLKDRRVDALFYTVGAPYSAFMELATERSLRLVSMNPEEQKRFVKL